MRVKGEALTDGEMRLYNAVFSRGSVRRYRMKPIPEKLMGEINEYLNSVSMLHADALYRVAVVETPEGGRSPLRGSDLVNAPYYMVLFAKDHPWAYKNAGFVMEQIVLYLTARGLGTCYLGGVRSTGGEEKNLSKDAFREVITAAFGYPAETEQGSTRGRKSLAQICQMHGTYPESMNRILETARLAPSSGNRQPWRFAVYPNKVHIFMKDRILQTKHDRELEEVDMGIVMAHLALAAEEYWMDWKLQSIRGVAEKDLRGYSYVATLTLTDESFPKAPSGDPVGSNDFQK